MDDIIHCCVAVASSFTAAAAKAMGDKVVDLSSAHWCDLQSGVLSLSSNATRVVLSLSWNPRLGRACSQAPDSLLHVASSLAWDLASGALSNKAWDVAQTLGKSHAF